MSFLEFFHFDKDPFPLNSSYNYVFKNKAQFNIIDEVVNNLRFYHGIYSIVGHSGIGKTFMLNQILMQVKNNDFTFFICANEKTNLFKMFAEQFSLKKYEENDIIQFISKHYKNGENIFFFIDDFQNLNESERIKLFSLLYHLNYINIIVAGDKSIIKILKDKKFPFLKKSIRKIYKISHFSIWKSMRYINSISIQALSLSQYKQLFGFFKRFLISFFSNRNINDINLIASSTLKEAYKNKNSKITFHDVFYAIKINLNLVKENLYFKFQKIFFVILILISLFFAIKIVIDRQFLLQKIEIEKSIDEQEQNFQNFF